MSSEVDIQVLVFIIFFALATVLVLLTRRREKHQVLTRCASCGRTLDPDRDRKDLCSDCYRMSRI